MLLALIVLTAACSSQKNTAKSRWWHSFNTRYNTYYNGSVAYIDGSLEKENANKDNFTEIIPLYTVGNKQNRETGKGNFDKAIEKCQKAIKLHSIKRRPEWNKKRRKTEKDIEWLSRKEYNPFLWKAWLLMGRAQFHKGAFDEAASTFSYMSRLYQNQPAIYGRARAWLAKCYVEQDWMYDAEDVIRNMRRDSIHWRAQKEWDYTYADYYIHSGNYEQAIPYLRKVIKHEMRSKQRAREWFLMGQLQSAVGRKDLALKAYKHVVRQNPPYEVEFNARIAMTEVLASGQAKQMISRLKRMAASDKNKDYLDQVYYAIGNIYLAQNDTARAISAYEKGNEKATRSGIEKGVLLLKLGDIYWVKEKYNDAQRCYGEAIGLLDKERDDYEQLSNRSKVLDELVPFTDAVHLQDSLQLLAKMDEKDRNEAIDRVIQALIKKEKEEAKKAAEQNAQEVQRRNGGTGNINQNTPAMPNAANQQNGLWYFYNPMAVNQGKAAFQKQWGKRENVDDWQRINKTVVDLGGEGSQLTDAHLDSIAQAEAMEDSLSQVTDSAQNDPHKREYYLAQIPFTEEQVEASNLIIMDGLYHSGVIFKDKLDNLPLSEKALRRLTDQYPTYEGMANAYYHLFLLYSRMGMHEVAAQYIELLKAEYPDNEWTTVLTDPYFAENARFGEHMEDSLYAATYDAFKADRYDEIRSNNELSESRFPLGAHRDKFIFINGMGKLNMGNADGCLEDMKTIVEKYPQSDVSALAGMIVNGVKAGRKLQGGKFDLSSVWERRTAVLADSDSIAARKLSADRNVDFVFMIAYQPDSIDENQLLYQLAKYNFTNYMVRNFDINIEEDGGLHLMQVTGFRNYDEALQYARAFHKQQGITGLLGKSRTIVISQVNLPLLGQQFSYDDYDKFYDKHFAPLKISTYQLLAEPADINSDPEDQPTKKVEEPTIEEIDQMLDNGEYFDNGLEGAPTNSDGTFVNPDEETVIPAQIEENLTPINNNDNRDVNEEEPDDNGIIIPADDDQGEDDGIIIPTDEEEQPGINRQPDVIIPDVPEEQPAITPQPEEKPEVKPQPEVKPEVKPQPEEKPEIKPQPEPEILQTPQQPKKDDDDDFYFDEEPTTPAPAKQTNKDNKDNKNTYDLEDEYYDLDGF